MLYKLSISINIRYLDYFHSNDGSKISNEKENSDIYSIFFIANKNEKKREKTTNFAIIQLLTYNKIEY